MAANPGPGNSAHIDGNQQFSIVGVSGTLGTSDTGGTADTVPVGANPATGAMYVQDLSGASGTTTVQMVSGTLNVGTVVIPSGTINVGTFTNLGSNVNVVTGTVTTGSLTNVAIVGTATGVGVVSNVTNGSINVLTGTLQSSGTTTGVGVVSNVTTGSINVLTGTLQSSGTTTGVGVVSNLTNGSVNILTGTTTLVSTVTTVSNLTNGSVNLLTGTVTSVSNLAGGTVQVNPVPIPTVLSIGTLGTAGGSFFGTLSAASGAGTKHYISNVDVVMNSGTADVRILTGTVIQGTGVLAAGNFPAGGGIAKNFNPAFATGTNSELTYHFVGAGTAFITVNYWKGA